MITTILVFFGSTGLAGHLYAKIVIIAFTFNHLTHTLLDGIPVRGIHIDGIADRCVVIGKHNAAAVGNLINERQIVAGSVVGNGCYIPGKSDGRKVVGTLSDC